MKKKWGRVPQSFSDVGFTIIELLIVIAIIGILATIIIVSVEKVRSQTRDTVRLQELDQLKTALAYYYTDNHHYPINNPTWGVELIAYSPWDLTNNTWALGNTQFYSQLVPKYLPALPLDPSGSVEDAGGQGSANYLGDNYPIDRGFFYYSSDGQSYTIGTNLEKPGLPENFITIDGNSGIGAGNYIFTQD